jgi:hypothetical protein
MPRYVKMSTRWSTVMEDEVQDIHLTVYEENDPIPTGVLDSDGNEFYRMKETVPMGFHRRTEK